MKLQPVSPDDWKLWREVRLQALADAPEAFGSSLPMWQSADEARWRQRLSAVPFNVVALINDEPVGQVSGAALDPQVQVELTAMWVEASARGAGVADALVEAVKGYAEEAGAAAVRLLVRRRNQRAIAMYRRCGFVASRVAADEPTETIMVYDLS